MQHIFLYRPIPVFEQFLLAELCPGQDQVLLASGHCANQQSRRVNGEAGTVLPEARVKMRVLMLFHMISGNDYTVSERRRQDGNSSPDPAPDSPAARIEVAQHVGAVAGGQIIGANIGQMTVQRDAIIQTFQHIHERSVDRGGSSQTRGGPRARAAGPGRARAGAAAGGPGGRGPVRRLPLQGPAGLRLGGRRPFYGRRAATEALLDALRRGRLAVLHAESGAGKSSLLQAGIAAHFIGAGRLDVTPREPGGTRVALWLPNVAEQVSSRGR